MADLFFASSSFFFWLGGGGICLVGLAYIVCLGWCYYGFGCSSGYNTGLEFQGLVGFESCGKCVWEFGRLDEEKKWESLFVCFKVFK